MITDKLDSQGSVDMEAALAAHGALDGFLLPLTRIEQDGDGRKFRAGTDLRPVFSALRRIVRIDMQEFCHCHTLQNSSERLYAFGK